MRAGRTYIGVVTGGSSSTASVEKKQNTIIVKIRCAAIDGVDGATDIIGWHFSTGEMRTLVEVVGVEVDEEQADAVK